MDNEDDENLHVTIEPSYLTIGLIVSIVLLTLCSFVICLRRGRRAVVRIIWQFITSENEPPIQIYREKPWDEENCTTIPKVQLKQSPRGSSSLRFNGNVIQMTERRAIEEEPSIVGVGNSRTYGVSGNASGLSADEDLQIYSMLSNLEDPRTLLKSMILEDATSDSNLFSLDEKGDDSTVYVSIGSYDGRQVVMKYPNREVVSITPSLDQGWRDDTNCHTPEEERLFSVESYSPMNREAKVQYEESDTSRMVSKSVLTMRSVQSRTFSSRPKARAIMNISESLRPVYSESLSPVFSLGDEFCTEEEDDEKTSPVRQSVQRAHEVSIESIVLANVGNPVLRHNRSYLNIPNGSSPHKRGSRIARNKRTRAASEDEESISHQPCARVRGEQVDRSLNEDSMKSLTKNASKSQKRSMPEKQIIHDTRPTETKHYLNYHVNSQMWHLEESRCDSIRLDSLSKGEHIAAVWRETG